MQMLVRKLELWHISDKPLFYFVEIMYLSKIEIA